MEYFGKKILHQHTPDYQLFHRYELFYSRIRLQQEILVLCLPHHMSNIERYMIRHKNDINLSKPTGHVMHQQV